MFDNIVERSGIVDHRMILVNDKIVIFVVRVELILMRVMRRMSMMRRMKMRSVRVRRRK